MLLHLSCFLMIVFWVWGATEDKKRESSDVETIKAFYKKPIFWLN